MGVLDTEIRYDDVAAAGALELYSERYVRRWFGENSSITVDEALSSPTHPGHIFWAVMRERYVPAPFLHSVAIGYAAEFLERGHARQAYVDFRLSNALGVKQAWLEHTVSLGAVHAASEKAEIARLELAELNDAAASACAQIVCHALHDDAENAHRSAFYTFIETYHSHDDFRWLIWHVRHQLGRAL